MSGRWAANSGMKSFIKAVPLLGAATAKGSRWPLVSRLRNLKFQGSASFWEGVYQKGETSGPGSYGRLAVFKAEILNKFVREKAVNSVIEFGCGDGAQLELATYPKYVGVDVSTT